MSGVVTNPMVIRSVTVDLFIWLLEYRGMESIPKLDQERFLAVHFCALLKLICFFSLLDKSFAIIIHWCPLICSLLDKMMCQFDNRIFSPGTFSLNPISVFRDGKVEYLKVQSDITITRSVKEDVVSRIKTVTNRDRYHNFVLMRLWGSLGKAGSISMST